MYTDPGVRGLSKTDRASALQESIFMGTENKHIKIETMADGYTLSEAQRGRK